MERRASRPSSVHAESIRNRQYRGRAGTPGAPPARAAIISSYGDDSSPFRGLTREIRAGHRTRSPRTASDRVENLLLVLDSFWRSAEHQCVPRLSGTARSLAGAEPQSRGIRGAGGNGFGVPHQRSFHLCTKELFLSRLAEGLPDFAIRQAARRVWIHRHRSERRQKENRHHPPSPRRRRGQEPARGLRRLRS